MSHNDAVSAAVKTLESVWDDALLVDPISISHRILIPHDKDPVKALPKPNSSLIRRIFSMNKKGYPIHFMPASKMQTRLIPDAQIESSACFSRYDEAFICYYREQSTDQKQRFAQAHALGHIMLGHVRPFSDKVKIDEAFPVTPNDQEDYEANVFASEILMPRRHIGVAVQSWPSITKLASLFGVSTTAIDHRLRDLGYL